MGTRPAPTYVRLGWFAVGVALLAGCGGPTRTETGDRGSSAPAPATTARQGVESTRVPVPTTAVRPTTSQPEKPTTSRPPAVAPPSTSARPPATVRPRGPYTDWNWPSTSSVAVRTAQDLNLTVLSDPGPATPYFFAHQFGFDQGVGGYVGLQTRGSLGPQPDAPLGKIAILSVFAGCDDRAATSGCARPLPIVGSSAQPGLLNGSFCLPLTSPSGNAPEGPGATCRVPFEWREGVTYGLQVILAAPDLWQANVVDGRTGAITVVGQIRVPDAWGGLSTFSVTWIEYYGDTGVLRTCGDIPLARARWEAGAGTESVPGGLLGLGSTPIVSRPTAVNNHLSTGTGQCSNSSITDLSPTTSGAFQVVGGS